MTAEPATNRPSRRRPAPAAAVRTALAVAILTPASALAQVGVIAGQVTDSAGDALPGVFVVAVAENSEPAEPERLRPALTDRRGRYRITGVPTGTYSVTFQLLGVGRAVRNGVDVRATSTTAVDVALTPGVVIELTPGGDADVPVVMVLPPAVIGPPRVTIGGFGHALDCALPPSGVIEDCRPVLVAPPVSRFSSLRSRTVGADRAQDVWLNPAFAQHTGAIISCGADSWPCPEIVAARPEGRTAGLPLAVCAPERLGRCSG